jgi:hypothetical protein
MTSTDNVPIVSSASTASGRVCDRLSITGRLLRVARPRSETYEPLEDPERCLSEIREGGLRADLFSFAQRFSQPEPLYNYRREMEPVAILRLGTYDKWWKQTINDKTRNMVRKAGKKGVQIEVASYTDDFVGGIKQVYDECPIRQGKKSRHYGKSFEVIRREHSTFLEQSEFIAARVDQRLVGFAKVVFQKDFASIMNLIALLGERDKAPTNALLAKVVERCSARGIGLLHYGVWSRRGFGDFKAHHGFECREIPRYYVPLNRWGALALQRGWHRPVGDRLPEKLADWGATVRTRWYAWRYPMK